MPSDMMLCVISYWVLSGAKRRQIQQLRCCVLPTKLLKRRDVYLKLTRHNGRAGTHGTYNPKHNDRSFNLANSEHIDPERAKGNIYWDCFHGFRSALAPPDPDDLAATFSDVERQFYETHYTAFVESQNERNAKIRHTERNRSIPDLLSSRKTCPEETIYQLGTKDDHASGEVLLAVVTEFIEEFKARFGDHVHVLDWALHLDESTPHIHERHVFDCENKHGEVAPQQEKALEALGFDLPDPDKPLSRRNNRKITFDTACRKMLFDIAKRHGLELEEEAEYGNRKYLEKQDFILAKQKELLSAQQNRLDELTLKVSDMETLLEDAAALTGTAQFDFSRRAVAVLCADNGVVAQGVSQTDQSVTRAVAENLAARRTSVCQMAKTVRCEVVPVDLGMAGEPVPGVQNCRIAAGTACVGQHWTADCTEDGTIVVQETQTAGVG